MSTARKVQKRRNKQRSRSTDDRGEEGHKTTHSNENDGAEDDEDVGDDFESLYKGEISKSGAPILPSKRARKIPEKIQVSKEDIEELSQTAQPDVDNSAVEQNDGENADVSLDEVSEAEEQNTDTSSDDSDTNNT